MDKHSRYRGVYACGKKWKSQIQVNGKLLYLGLFDSQEDAAKCYDAKLRESFRQSATNFTEFGVDKDSTRQKRSRMDPKLLTNIKQTWSVAFATGATLCGKSAIDSLYETELESQGQGFSPSSENQASIAQDSSLSASTSLDTVISKQMRQLLSTSHISEFLIEDYTSISKLSTPGQQSKRSKSVHDKVA